jgi:oligopeptide transport system substrate-binding protein
MKHSIMSPRIVLASVLLGLIVTSSAFARNGADIGEKSITVSITQEPRSLNTLTAESVSYTAQLLVHLNEGLMRYDGRRRLTGGVAERWEVDSDQIRFWLRSDAQWENGEPVTAHDFVFAWRMLLNPDTAAPSANLASPIKNAAKVLTGELEANALGVKAISDLELVVDLEHPCGWCLKLMTNSIFYPINQGFYEQAGEDYGTSPATHLSNGAFKLADWSRGMSVTALKNERYWRRDKVHLNRIIFDYIGADTKTQLNLFRAGELAAANLDRDSIPDAMSFGYRLRTYPTGHLFNIQFSHVDGMLSANKNLRKAVSLVIDKDTLVNRVVASPGTRITDSMFHDWLTVENTKFISARPPTKHKQDIALAKKHLAAAREELDLPERPRLTLTINDSNLYGRVAEYYQALLDRHLNIELAIDPQTTQMMVDKWRNGSSDMTLITWPVDVDDPMDQISFLGDPSFRSIFKGLYAGDDMAALFYEARSAIELEHRLDTVNRVHEFFTEEVTVLPLFESYGATVVHPSVKGYVWQPVRGYGDYRYVRLIQKPGKRSSQPDSSQ